MSVRTYDVSRETEKGKLIVSPCRGDHYVIWPELVSGTTLTADAEHFLPCLEFSPLFRGGDRAEPEIVAGVAMGGNDKLRDIAYRVDFGEFRAPCQGELRAIGGSGDAILNLFYDFITNRTEARSPRTLSFYGLRGRDVIARPRGSVTMWSPDAASINLQLGGLPGGPAAVWSQTVTLAPGERYGLGPCDCLEVPAMVTLSALHFEVIA